MGRTLKEKLERLSPERRQNIESEFRLFIAEEMTRQQMRQTLKFTHELMGISEIEESKSDA